MIGALSSTVEKVCEIDQRLRRIEALLRLDVVDDLVSALKMAGVSRAGRCWCPEWRDIEGNGHSPACQMARRAIEKVGLP